MSEQRHGHDAKRCNQPNRWFGGDTCECLCGCAFLAVGHDDRNPKHDKPLCPRCEEAAR